MPSDFLEKTLEDIIYSNRFRIHKRGFPKFYFCTNRQFRLPSGKIIDLFTWELRGDVLYCRIIELKKDKSCADALWQVLEYYEEIITLVYREFSGFEVEIVIVGNSVSTNLENLRWITPHLSLYKYIYEYDGISFKETGSYIGDAKKEYYKKGESGSSGGDGKIFCDILRNKILKKYEFSEKHHTVAEYQSFNEEM